MRRNRAFQLLLLLLPVALLFLPVASSGESPATAAAPPPSQGIGIQGELGANDFRISHMATDGDISFYALSPAVAYNSDDDEYLVVWAADDNTAPLVNDEFEIYGQRVDAATGVLLGPRFRISDMGPDGDPAFDACDPAVAYDSANQRYLVVWQGDDDTAPLVGDEFEAFGQLLAADGTEIGPNDFRISDMGPDGDPAFDALNPDVASNAANGEFLVVWHGDDSADNVVEIYGQRIDAVSGGELGNNDFAISDMGADPAEGRYRGQDAAVAYNSTDDQYLVVWEGDDDSAPLVDGELEIFGQFLAADGSEIGTDDFRISDLGPDGSPGYGADNPAVAYATAQHEYLVVWSGDDDRDFGSGPLANGEMEVYGQRLAADGSEVGDNDFRISDMGTDGDPAFRTFGARVAYVAAADEYLVVWRGDDNRDFGSGSLADDEMEIFGQQLAAASGAEVGDNDTRWSDMGNLDGDPAFDADRPALAVRDGDGAVLVVWQGDDEAGDLVSNEVEILGQRWVNGATGVTLAWFTATARDGAITVAWETASEIDLLGFHVYHAEAVDGPRTRLNEALLPGQAPGSPVGAVYEFVDEAVAPGLSYWYWLEAMDVRGAATLHGPVSAMVPVDAAYRVYLPLVLHQSQRGR